MADIDLDSRTDTGREARRDMGRSPSRPVAKMVSGTETRRSLMTSEFWLTVAMAAALVIAGYWTDANLRVAHGWALAAGVVAAYVLSRGLAKCGSRDTVIRDLD